MLRLSTASSHAILSALCLCAQWLIPNVSATVPQPMQQGFLFDWSGDQSPPTPIAQQCEMLHITWGRRSATGPSPVAPYYLQIYTSAFVVPFVIPAGSGQSFDWPVPFIPGTQFQICMMASNGVTGGCQEIYTVYQPPDTTLDKPPVCQNLTYPAGALEVDPKTADGSWSQYGWIDQCSDISITPKNGTPPFTYTVAPALRPPINITSDTADTINWQVSLAFGLPFWLSVIDSTGGTWTHGPLHAGGDGSTACLVDDSDSSSRSGAGFSTGGTVGVAVGALALGLLAGALGAHFLLRRRTERYTRAGALALRRKSLEPLDASGSSPGLRQSRGSAHDIDPYLVFPEDGQAYSNTYPYPYPHTPGSAASTVTAFGVLQQQQGGSRGHTHTGSSSGSPTSPTGTIQSQRQSQVPMPPSPFNGPQGGGGSQVYVVHHDAGRPPPVTVFTSDGTEVVELPPQYESAARGSGEQRQQPQQQQQQRSSPGARARPTTNPLQGAERRQPRGLPAKAHRASGSLAQQPPGAS
ncbi:hypothetical protein C8Q80DRAFT_96039 [Daedaleopsis nitida]|nr:hypothetical protein C8Q80DRAFT_96039 [Daedaleopsis nitida]